MTNVRYIELQPGAAVQVDTSPGLPCIYAFYKEISDVRPVVHAIDATWLRTGDIRESWLAGKQAADLVNQAVRSGGRSNLVHHKAINEAMEPESSISEMLLHPRSRRN